MNTFKIKKIRNSKYCCVIFSLSYINPLESWGEIEQELATKKLCGDVLIDLFVTNGVSNRFFSLKFDGIKIDASSITGVGTVSDGLRQTSVKFYNSHLSIMEAMPITDENMFKIKHCISF